MLPLSKSIAARRLILDYIYRRDNDVITLPECDDTRELSSAILQLRSHPKGDGLNFDLGSGGTSFRFFVALVASLPDFEGRIDCSDLLRNRPLLPLIEALRSAGAEIIFEGNAPTPPLIIKGKRLSAKDLKVDTTLSTQFASAIAMASLLWEKPWRPRIISGMPSSPYLKMTLQMIDDAQVGVFPEIEADWSAASYFYEYTLLNPGVKIILEGLKPQRASLQGDARCKEIFAGLGVNTSWRDDGSAVISCETPRVNQVHINMSETPDLVPALAVALCGAGIPFTLSGIANLRVKESDRVASLCSELGRFGYRLKADKESISYSGTPDFIRQPKCLDSHGDHRIAMCMAVLSKSLYRGGIIGKIPMIRGAEAVSKSYPGFFEDLRRLNL